MVTENDIVDLLRDEIETLRKERDEAQAIRREVSSECIAATTRYQDAENDLNNLRAELEKLMRAANDPNAGLWSFWNDKAREFLARAKSAEAELAQARKALERYDAIIDGIHGCGDGNCLIKRPKGMHTNGGCRCWSDRMKSQKVMMASQKLASDIRALITGTEGEKP